MNFDKIHLTRRKDCRKENNMFKSNVDFQRFAEEASGAAQTTGEESLPAAGDNSTGAETDTKESGRKSFDELICGEYKKEYGRKVEEVVKKRLKSQKELEEKLNKLSPVISELKDKLGVGDDDPESLIGAINESLDFSPATRTDADSVENETAAEENQHNIQTLRNNALEIARDLEAVKDSYPNFDAAKELSDPDFRAMLAVPGMTMKKAFEIKYHDDILTQAMQYAASVTEKKLADSIAQRIQRPGEGANSASAAAVVSGDPSALSREARMEIKKRVRRGEKIVW